LKRFLVDLAVWTLKRLGHKLAPIPNELILLVEALLPVILKVEEEHPKESGEYRRHQVYAKGLKLFPNAARDDIGLAIEYGVRKMKGKTTWR